MGRTSVAVCGVVPVAAIYSAGIVACRIHTGTIGTVEGSLVYYPAGMTPPKYLPY